MRYEQDDYIMRQIEMVTRLVTQLTKGMDTAEETQNHREAENVLLYGELMRLIEAEQINEAENLLFERLENHDTADLKTAVDFYCRLNAFDDDRLEAAGFSREEIKSGLDDVMGMFGIQNL